MKQACVILLLASIFCCALRNANCHDFTYNGNSGPAHWGEDNKKCNGKHQSPININVVDVVNRTFPYLELQNFGSKPAMGQLLNNGHTVLVQLEYDDNLLPAIWGGPLADKGKFIFSQFHFHWGENDTVGSEDRINNVSFAAELHIVFRNAKYATFDEAVNRHDGVAVMAFFYAIDDEDNPRYAEFTTLLDDIRTPGAHATFRHPPTLGSLVIMNFPFYYTYTGSLTTPPCSEDVTWIDFEEPIMISERQIAHFRHLYTSGGIPLTHNFRPIQPLNNRIVYKAVYPRYSDGSDSFVSSIPFIDAVEAARAGSRSNAFLAPSWTLLMGVFSYALSQLVRC